MFGWLFLETFVPVDYLKMSVMVLRVVTQKKQVDGTPTNKLF